MLALPVLDHAHGLQRAHDVVGVDGHLLADVCNKTRTRHSVSGSSVSLASSFDDDDDDAALSLPPERIGEGEK